MPPQRTHAPERMDAPDAPRAELDEALKYLRFVNRRLGGWGALRRHLASWSRNWPDSARLGPGGAPASTPIALLDIATGSADIPIAARAWALSRGFDLRITAIDRHATTLDLARVHLAAQPEPVRAGITLRAADALRLTDSFADDAFDYCHAALFLHHLSDIEALTVLRVMDRLARRGVVWSDLIRSPLHEVVTGAALRWAPEMARHDGRVSVRAGFTRREALDLARRAGVTYARYRLAMPPYRFTVAGERPGAWR